MKPVNASPMIAGAPRAVSSDEERLILVDEHDRPIGEASKLECHLGEGLLHRAFSLLLFDRQGRLLMQQRAAGKLLWPSYWSNSCCSHPRQGETLAQAVRRRAGEELGVSVNPRFEFRFHYEARYGSVGVEREMCSVFTAVSDALLRPNPLEVDDVRWLNADTVDQLVAEDREVTPWFVHEWTRLRSQSQWPQSLLGVAAA